MRKPLRWQPTSLQTGRRMVMTKLTVALRLAHFILSEPVGHCLYCRVWDR